jgi:hypothetical protein
MKVFVWVLGQLFTWAVDSDGGILDSEPGPYRIFAVYSVEWPAAV